MSSTETALATSEITVASVLSAYAALTEKVNELERERRALRKLVNAVSPGIYAGWSKSYGAPGRILDTQAAREQLETLGHEVPMKETAGSLVIEYVGDQGGEQA